MAGRAYLFLKSKMWVTEITERGTTVQMRWQTWTQAIEFLQRLHDDDMKRYGKLKINIFEE